MCLILFQNQMLVQKCFLCYDSSICMREAKNVCNSRTDFSPLVNLSFPLWSSFILPTLIGTQTKGKNVFSNWQNQVFWQFPKKNQGERDISATLTKLDL